MVEGKGTTRKRRSDVGRKRGASSELPASAPVLEGAPAVAAVLPDAQEGVPEAPPIIVSEGEVADRPAPRSYTSRKKAQEQAEQTAAVLMVILSGMAVTAFGEEAKLTDDERQMIEPPLARIMARMDPVAAAAIEKWTDPILLLFGFATWGVRLAQIVTARGDDGGPKKAPPEAEPPSPKGNGRMLSQEIPAAGPPAELFETIRLSSTGEG